MFNKNAFYGLRGNMLFNSNGILFLSLHVYLPLVSQIIYQGLRFSICASDISQRRVVSKSDTSIIIRKFIARNNYSIKI